ncbi:MAG: phage portal protein [Cyanobacteria bacterium J06623_7]
MGFLSFVRKLWDTPPRHSIEHRAIRKRRYDGAQRGRNFGDWLTTSNSANADIWTALTTLRNRSRDIIRNNGYGRGAIQKYVDNVVYMGISFQSQVKQLKDKSKTDDRLNNLIEGAFKTWAAEPKYCHTAGKLDFNGIQQLVFRSCWESGEVFVRKVKQSFSGSPVPFALEVIEADQLAEDHNSSAAHSRRSSSSTTGGHQPARGNRIVMGVEVNQWQRPEAYWFYKEHPGELFQGRGGHVSRELERIPASEIIHLHLTERPNQLRGLPILYSEITRLKNIGDYEGAEQLAAKLSACLMGAIKTPFGDVLPEHKGDSDGEELPADEKFEPGMMRYYAPGEEIDLLNPTRPNPNLVAFIESQLRAMGAGTGQSYEVVSNDYSKTNYSSSRLSLTNSRDRYKVLQIWFSVHFLREVVFGNCEDDGWLDMAVLSGVLNFPDYELRPDRYRAVKWQFRGWSWIDPYKEVQATIASLASGITNFSSVYAEQGKDFEESMRAIARERELLKELGIEINLDGYPVNPEKDDSNSGNAGKVDKEKAVTV